MKHQTFRSIAVVLLALFFAQSTFATCGGGGGGGGGGMSNSGGGGGSNAPVYIVPWKVRKPTDAPAQGLVLYWFPATVDEMKKSSLRESRTLSLYASQCVSMEWADGTPISKVENINGKLKLPDVEKLVDTEMNQRKAAVKGQMKDAADKAKSGDKDGAIAIYKSVGEQKCLFKKEAYDAAKELKKLGVAKIGAM